MTTKLGRLRRKLLSFIAVASLGVLLIFFGVVLVSLLQSHKADQTRRIAYAATATYVALPSVTSPAVIPDASHTPSPILMPTSQDLAILPTATVDYSAIEDVPPPAEVFPQQNTYELVNFLVVGSDSFEPSAAYRTDVILIVSVNWSAQTVNLLSIPRDLYVYIPGWGMDRINTSELHQTQTNQTRHRLGLLAETIEYNLGIRIDHVARVDFTGFEILIDSFGGVVVPVDCAVSGYQPAPSGSGWVPFTLQPGIHNMTGARALWYVRQRMDSSDFDRNRRQQIVLRSLWQKAVESGLAVNLPAIWDTLTTTIETDVTLEQALSYIPLFLRLDSSKVESHFLGLDEVNLWRTPSGASVLVLDHEPLRQTLISFLTPPVENQLHQELARIDVYNASSIPDADRLAAARLQWFGLFAVAQGAASNVYDARTTVLDHTGRLKGSSLTTVQSALDVAETNVYLVLEDDSGADFSVIIGDDYQTCSTSPWIAFEQPD